MSAPAKTSEKPSSPAAVDIESALAAYAAATDRVAVLKQYPFLVAHLNQPKS